MPIIDNRVPPTLQHDCTMFGHVGPCRACIADARACIADAQRQAAQGSGAAHPMRNVEVSPFAPPPASLRYACSTCPACSCADRNATQEATPGAPGVVPSIAYAAQVAAHNAGRQERTFTRPEVLAVLRSRKAMFPVDASPLSVGQQNELTALISVFERME